MKKNSSLLKKTMCASLAVITAMSFAGCNKSGDGGDGGKGGNGNSSGKNVSAVLSKEGIYKEKQVKFDFMSTNEYIMDVKLKDDTLNILSANYEGSMSVSTTILKGYSVDKEGKVLSEVEYLTPDYADMKKKMDEEGGASDLPIAVGSALTEQEVIVDEGDDSEVSDDVFGEDNDTEAAGFIGTYDEENYGPEEYESLSYYTAKVGKDGNVYAIKNHNKSETVNGEYTYKNDYSMCAWDANGTLKWEAVLEIPEESEDNWYYVSNMVMTDKNLYVIVSGTDSFAVSVDFEGKVGNRKPIPADMDFYDGSIFQDLDGNVYVSNYKEQGGIELVSINLDTMQKGSALSLPSAVSANGWNRLYFISNQDIFYCNDMGVYSYHFGDEAPKLVMNYINSDVNTSGFEQMFYVDDKSFYAVYNEPVNYDTVCSFFTKVNPEDVPDKQIIELAGLGWIESDMRERIINFNKESDQYKIVIRDYSQYNTEEDYNAGITQLNNDIIAGNIPDILVTDNLKVENYVSKGLLVDIGEKIANDPELSKKEFMQNVFDAYKVEGKLYEVIPSFMAVTMVAKKSVVGDRTSWTMQEMQDTLATLGSDAVAFSDMDRQSFLSNMLMFNYADYVDRNTGKCNFNSQQFIDALKFAKTLPEEINYEDEEWDYENYQSQYRTNKTMLMPLYIYEFQYLKTSINGYMGEPVSFIGFPSGEGNGSVVTKTTGFAISSKSKNIDGAWQFIRQFLMDDYQQNMSFYLPVDKKCFLEKSQEAGMKSFYIDENGKRVEYDDSFYINGEELPLEPLSQDQINEIVDFISNIKISGQTNEDIEKIIEEESGAFFAGKKSAEEVADIIQSRAQVFVNENR